MSPQETIRICTIQIQRNPNDVEGYKVRGYAYQELKQYDLAISDFSKAIQLNPNWNYPYTCRRECYKALGWV